MAPGIGVLIMTITGVCVALPLGIQVRAWPYQGDVIESTKAMHCLKLSANWLRSDLQYSVIFFPVLFYDKFSAGACNNLVPHIGKAKSTYPSSSFNRKVLQNSFLKHCHWLISAVVPTHNYCSQRSTSASLKCFRVVSHTSSVLLNEPQRRRIGFMAWFLAFSDIAVALILMYLFPCCTWTHRQTVLFRGERLVLAITFAMPITAIWMHWSRMVMYSVQYTRNPWGSPLDM